jgi:serine/threonine protein kinase/tetratricopeptide (TPR) repeat protein
MQPDGGDAGNDGAETVDVDAGGAETIDRVIGGQPERAETDREREDREEREARERGERAPPRTTTPLATPLPVPPQMTSATRGIGGRRRKPATSGMFAATQMGLGITPGDDAVSTDVLPPVVAVAPGTVLANRYHVGQMVGQGGMGTVYAARDVDLDEEVALKVLRPDLARDESYRARLRGEVRIARRVSHPNVCRVHDLGVSGELVFVTMEMVHGRTLRQLLAEMRAGRLLPFDLAQVVDVLVQIGSALTAAHRAGVIHRDVKPDNVILTDGRAVLTDFGVATRTTERAEVVAGTPAYLAPEVLRHEPFDHKVDVYALAVVAYEMLTGRTPYQAKSIEQATVVAASRPPYPELPPELATAEIRAALDRALARALSPDPLLRTPAIERFTEAFALATRAGPGLPATPGRPGTTPGDTSPPTTDKRSTAVTEAGSVSGSTPARRPEVRVATALVWRSEEVAARAAKGAPPPAIDDTVDTGIVTGVGSAAVESAERIIVDAGGVPIQIRPGELIALFGVPRSRGDDADRATRAALGVVAALGGRAAIDTTRVLLRPGVPELAGPDVAIGASALVALAPAGVVIASAAASRQLAARFEVAPAEATGGRRVIGVRAAIASPAIETYRARELAAIDAHLERAFRERTPVFVDVRGAAGAGKTRLREAMVAAVGARREVDWLVAVASPVGAPSPLSTVNAASREWYDAATGGGAITDPARRYNAARRWLEARAVRRPIVVVIEDIQWADPSTHGLLEHLRAGLDEVPVAIVTFTRTDDTPTAAPPLGVDVVTLGPLDDAAATKLAREVAPDASPAAIAGVVARAAGIPFFIEELARELADGGTTTLPTSIEAVIQARLDHLPELANHVIQAGAVIGRGFWRSAVGALTGVDGAALDEALAELVRRGIIAPAAQAAVDDDRYEFTQGLVRDVAYQRIPPRDRRQHHAAVATWLDTHTTVRGRDDIGILLDAAHHREQSGDTAGAALAYRRAGERCLHVFAYGEAATALERAVALHRGSDPALREALGDALAESRGPAAAEAAFRIAASELQPGDAPGAARLGYKLGLAATRRGDTTTAIDRYRTALALAMPDGTNLAPWAEKDPRTAAALLGGLGWTLGYQLARVDEGHPLCERGVALLEATPYRRELARALSRLGGTYMRACRFADQLKCNERNLEIAKELGDLDMQLTAHINLGVVLGLLGAIDDAVDNTTAARQLAAKIGAAPSAGLAASNLAGLLLEQGRLDAAETALDEAIDTIDRTGHRYVLCETYQFQARLAAAHGDLAAARHHAERSRALAKELGSPLDGAVATRILAQIAARAGQHAEARALIDEALAAAAAVDAFEAARTRAARARILRVLGDANAAAMMAEARAELGRLGAKRELAVLEDVNEVR